MPVPQLPPGGWMELPDRGRAWVWDTGGRTGRPAVVLLHGWSSTAALNWWPTFRRLGREFRVVAMDHRGHGRGLPVRGRFRLEDCADDVAALIGQLGIGPVIATGYSMGGPVAQLLWRRHRASVAGLVLCATGARLSSRPNLTPALGALHAGLSPALTRLPPVIRNRWLTRAMEARGLDSDLAAWTLAEQAPSDLGALVSAGVALNAFDSTRWIDTVDVPTAVVITTRDTLVSPARQWRLRRSIPGAVHFTVPGGHRACVEQARDFVPAVVEACRTVSEAVGRPEPARA